MTSIKAASHLLSPHMIDRVVARIHEWQCVLITLTKYRYLLQQHDRHLFIKRRASSPLWSIFLPQHDRQARVLIGPCLRNNKRRRKRRALPAFVISSSQYARQCYSAPNEGFSSRLCDLLWTRICLINLLQHESRKTTTYHRYWTKSQWNYGSHCSCSRMLCMLYLWERRITSMASF